MRIAKILPSIEWPSNYNFLHAPRPVCAFEIKAPCPGRHRAEAWCITNSRRALLSQSNSILIAGAESDWIELYTVTSIILPLIIGVREDHTHIHQFALSHDSSLSISCMRDVHHRLAVHFSSGFGHDACNCESPRVLLLCSMASGYAARQQYGVHFQSRCVIKLISPKLCNKRSIWNLLPGVLIFHLLWRLIIFVIFISYCYNIIELVIR